MKRYLILVAAVVMQMCLGATYSWSIDVQPVREMTGILQGSGQLPFTLFYFVFPTTMMVVTALAGVRPGTLTASHSSSDARS